MDARHGRRPAIAVVAVTALLAALVVVVAAGRANRRVILYGDSLAVEGRDAFALSLQRGNDVEVVDRTFGGTAICDRLDRMRRDLHDLQPSAVVLEFVGNAGTPCMRGLTGPLTGDDLLRKYRDDARTATQIFAGAGVRVYWMGAPSTATTEEAVFAGVRRGYEAGSRRLTFATPPLPRVRYVDAGQAALDRGRFGATLPCLPAAGASLPAAAAAPHTGPTGGSTTERATSDGRASPRPEPRWPVPRTPTPRPRSRKRADRGEPEPSTSAQVAWVPWPTARFRGN